MADKKVTIMVIKVDLGCEKCYKKIKKTLCKIPQIQSQIFDEKANTVTVTVVCCSPEKVKKMIYCKGGDSIKGIEIKEPTKPLPPTPTEKHKELEKTKEKHKEQKVDIIEPPKKDAAKQKQTGPPAPAHPRQQVRTCCQECYGGYGGGPCYHGFGMVAPRTYEGYGTPAPRPCYEFYGRLVYDSWGGGGSSYYGGCRRGCCGGRCECMNQENPNGCSAM